MNNIRALWNWLVKSSANPDKWALTVKGAVPTIVIILGYLGITGQGLDTSQLGTSAGEIAAQIATVITSVVTLVGLVRKLFLTFKSRT